MHDDDMELMAAIGRMVVNASELEYAVAELTAASEGLRDEECRERATAIVRKPGEAMRQFKRLTQERPDLGWLMRDTVGLLGARHFVAHAVPQQHAVAESRPALFILSPRQGETMITARQVISNARMISEGTGRIRGEIAAVLRGGLLRLQHRAGATNSSVVVGAQINCLAFAYRCAGGGAGCRLGCLGPRAR